MLKKYLSIAVLSMPFSGALNAFPGIISVTILSKIYTYLQKEYKLSKIPQYQPWELERKLDSMLTGAYCTGNQLAISLTRNAIGYHSPYADERAPLSSDMHTCLNNHPLIVDAPWLKEKKFVDGLHTVADQDGSISDVKRMVRSDKRNFQDQIILQEPIMHTLITVFGDCQKAAARK